MCWPISKGFLVKAKPYQVTSLIPQIQNGFKGALIFGPDFGVVQEISEKVASFIVSDLKDEFRISKITHSKIKEINSILLDEGNAPALFGGRKLVWLKDGDNSVSDAVQTYFDQIKSDSFLLITAGNLTKSSSLRNFCESDTNILAVACYADNARDVAGFIREILNEAHIQITPQALTLLIERLGENRAVTRKEIEKLITYIGNNSTVDVDDVRAIVTDTQNSSMDLFCHAVATGDHEGAEKAYRLLIENGENPVTIVRILYNYFNKLLYAADDMEKGSVEAALKKIMKPAQFGLKISFEKQLRIWKKSFILKVLNLLLDTEKKIKSTGMPAEVILGRTLLQITGVANRYK